ncbi:hypothetical protein F4778DRAFT_797913 [Xylariomycetidae sp. FL2044]|nr:hypothetical protein F4778DRAFT_797913 [Xylariomycetidae sp. FL2044]
MESSQAADDRGPSMNAAVWTLTPLALILLVLRLYCKFLSRRGLWWDDHVLIASWILLLVSSALVGRNVADGFGMHMEDIIMTHGPEKLSTIGLRGTVIGVGTMWSSLHDFPGAKVAMTNMYVLINQTLVLAAVWSKTSFAVTLLRITNGWLKVTIWVIIATMNVFMIFSALVNFIQCSPVEKVWKPQLPGTCWPSAVNVGIGIFAGAYSAVTDITLAMLPWAVIWSLQMKRREKVGVAVAMSMGLFAGATAIMKCVALETLASADFFYDGSQLVIWASAEVATTIMAASIPVLRVLAREFKSSAGRYYNHSSSAEGTRKTRAGKLTTATNTAIVTSTGRPQTSDYPNDDGSDRSILYGTGIGKITKTAEISVSFNDRSDADSLGYEMDRLPPRASPV